MTEILVGDKDYLENQDKVHCSYVFHDFIIYICVIRAREEPGMY